MLATDGGTSQILSAFRARLDTGRRNGGDPHDRPSLLGAGNARQPDPDDSLAGADSPNGGAPSLRIMQEFAVELGRLRRHLSRAEDLDQQMAQAVSIIPIPPQNYTVVSNSPKFKADKASGADSGPQEGYFWFITRLTIAGLGNGDAVTLHKVQSSTITNLSTALHTFGPGSASKSVDDWEPGVYGLPMWPDDSLFPVAASATLASTELLLTGNAIQVEARLLWKFVL